MLSTAFLFKKISFSDEDDSVTQVSWNRTDGWIACGGSSGNLRVLMIEFQDTHEAMLQGNIARQSRISVDRKLQLHDGAAITSVSWNEADERLTTADNRGLVVVCAYTDGRWVRELVNESTQSPVVSASWSPDSTKVLILYANGSVLLGAASGHKIFSGTLNQTEVPRFGYISDSRLDVFVIGWDSVIKCYDFEGQVRWQVSPPLNIGSKDRFVHSCWGQTNKFEFGGLGRAASPSRAGRSSSPLRNFNAQPKQIMAPSSTYDSTLIAVTASSILCIYSADTGSLLASVQTNIIPTCVQMAPTGQHLVISGMTSTPYNTSTSVGDDPHKTADDKLAGSTAIALVCRMSDLEVAATLRIPAKTAFNCSWDATGLRFAIAAGNGVYFASLRPYYRQGILRDGTIVYSLGSTITKTYRRDGGAIMEQAESGKQFGGLLGPDTRSNRGDECLCFWKYLPKTSSTPHQRWPLDFIDMVCCGNYVAILTYVRQALSDTSGIKRRSKVTFHTSVGAPAFSVNLAYIPLYIAGCDNYLVCASLSRVSIVDIRYLTGESADSGVSVSKPGGSYNPVFEWHADSSPQSSDRELTVAKLTVSQPIMAICCANNALFVAKSNNIVYRYTLPSLQSSGRVPTTTTPRVLRCNADGSALACVHEDATFIVYYTEHYISEEQQNARRLEKNDGSLEKSLGGSVQARASATAIGLPGEASNVSAMLGFDADPVAPGSSAVGSPAFAQSTLGSQVAKEVLAPFSPDLSDVWGIVFSPDDPSILAVSSRQKVYVLHLNSRTKEEAMACTAHILGFSGLVVVCASFDEIVAFGSPLEPSYVILETQRLRELKDAMYGAAASQVRRLPGADFSFTGVNLIAAMAFDDDASCVDNDVHIIRTSPSRKAPIAASQPGKGVVLDPGDDLDPALQFRSSGDDQDALPVNLPAAIAYVRRYRSAHLYKVVAEAALRELSLDVASYFFVRAEDYVSYHFTEAIRRLSSDEQKRAEIATFLGRFSEAERIYARDLGRPDLVIRNQTELSMWTKILQCAKDGAMAAGGILVDDGLATQAHRALGRYYLRNRLYQTAGTFLQKADDPELYAEALFRSEGYEDLRTLALSLPVEQSRGAILRISTILARVGDVEGASAALCRIGEPAKAVDVCAMLKRFDVAVAIAQKHGMLHLIDRELSLYLRQLLANKDDRAALDLLRKTSRGEVAAAVILNVAFKELTDMFDARRLPLAGGVFNKLRRLVVLAGKEATHVQRANMQRALARSDSSPGDDAGAIAKKATSNTLNQLLSDADARSSEPAGEGTGAGADASRGDSGAARTGARAEEAASADAKGMAAETQFASDPVFGSSRVRSVPAIWRIAQQTRYMIVACYLLYLSSSSEEQALWPIIEASGYYYIKAGVFPQDPYMRVLAKIALPAAIYALIVSGDFGMASGLMELMEADETLSAAERDQLEQLAVDVFKTYPPTTPPERRRDNFRLTCERCRQALPPYCSFCSCGWTATLCVRTGQPVKPRASTHKCTMCGSTATVGKSTLTVCPMCHEEYS